MRLKPFGLDNRSHYSISECSNPDFVLFVNNETRHEKFIHCYTVFALILSAGNAFFSALHSWLIGTHILQKVSVYCSYLFIYLLTLADRIQNELEKSLFLPLGWTHFVKGQNEHNDACRERSWWCWKIASRKENAYSFYEAKKNWEGEREIYSRETLAYWLDGVMRLIMGRRDLASVFMASLLKSPWTHPN